MLELAIQRTSESEARLNVFVDSILIERVLIISRHF